MTIMPFTPREIILMIILFTIIVLWVFAIRKVQDLLRTREAEQGKQLKQPTKLGCGRVLRSND